MPRGEIAEALGLKRLKGKEREQAIAEPGPSWKSWALQTGLKPWIALGMLILDALLLASLIQSSVPWSALAVLVPVLYSNYLVYEFLWAKPQEGFRSHRKFHPSLLQPFAMGRWYPEYAEWRAGRATTTGEVPPEEFI